MLIVKRVCFSSFLVNQWTDPPGQRIITVEDVNTQNYEISLFTLVGLAFLAFVAIILWYLRRRRSRNLPKPGETLWGRLQIFRQKNALRCGPFCQARTSSCLVLGSLNIFHFELFYF